MSKKAMEISPPSLIVVVILVLLVLVVLLFIFGGQSGEFVRIINEWREDISNRNKCENMLLGRYCDSSKCPDGYTARIVPEPPGEEGWTCGINNHATCYECIPVN